MEVKFHLPGLRQNYPLNMLVLSMLKQKPEWFREGVQIASFFGEFPTSLWNGGRPSNYDQCDAAFIRNVVKSINAQGVPVRYTYTNMLLTEEDLKDPYCNFCMQAADNGMNEVMIFSPILEKYIREKYPSYKLNSSTCKEIRDISQVNEELKKDYYLVVLDYNFNNNFEELAKIEDKARCEILVNTLCTPNCPRRGPTTRISPETSGSCWRTGNFPRSSKSLWNTGTANTENITAFTRYRATALIFLRMIYGKNMFPWVSTSSRSRVGPPTSFLWWRPMPTT